eukprot:scaffold93121_cov30-Tisochrysis_lutea.AAC.3
MSCPRHTHLDAGGRHRVSTCIALKWGNVLSSYCPFFLCFLLIVAFIHAISLFFWNHTVVCWDVQTFCTCAYSLLEFHRYAGVAGVCVTIVFRHYEVAANTSQMLLLPAEDCLVRSHGSKSPSRGWTSNTGDATIIVTQIWVYLSSADRSLASKRCISPRAIALSAFAHVTLQALPGNTWGGGASMSFAASLALGPLTVRCTARGDPAPG